MSRFRRPFNEKKATQLAARFLALAPGRRLPYMSLIKLMYFADRGAIERWATPITNDQYYSLDNGPILSAVKDLIDEGPSCLEPGFWASFISAPSNYMVDLIDDPGVSELSKAELALIDEVYQKYGKLSRWELRDETHTLKEWKNPEGSAIPISIEDILEATGLSSKDARQAAAELRSVRQVQQLLSRQV
jgi:uncharacterized phage-associated protein